MEPTAGRMLGLMKDQNKKVWVSVLVGITQQRRYRPHGEKIEIRGVLFPW